MMMNGLRYIATIILVSGIFLTYSSCSKEQTNQCLGGRGETRTESRGFYPFSNVSVYDNISLMIIQGQEYQASIITGKNIMPFITTEIKNNTLIIHNESACPMLSDPWNYVQVELTLPDFDSLFISTAGEVAIADTFRTDESWIRIEDSSGDINLNFDVFRLYVNYQKGTSDVFINGQGHDGIFYTAAYGVLDTREFIPLHTVINNSSSNDCFVASGIKTLDAKISNLGNIYYLNDPLYLIEVIEGSGELIKLD